MNSEEFSEFTLSRLCDCVMACSGVTFIGDDQTGIVKRMAIALQGMIDLYSIYTADGGEAINEARAILSQVRLEVEPPAADAAQSSAECTSDITWQAEMSENIASIPARPQSGTWADYAKAGMESQDCQIEP